VSAQAQISATADLVRQHQPVPGGIVVAVEQGGTLFVRPFGSADPQQHKATAATDRFEIGSISKLFTALLVGRLVDGCRLAFDDLVTDHLPWFAAGPHTGRITVAHLLAHSAGLIGGSDAVPDAAAQVWSLRERYAAEPGRHFHYSNVGYLALGELVRAVVGEPHWSVLQRSVFGPLGMRDALGRVTSAHRNLLAIGSTAAFDDRPWLPGDPLARSTWLEVDGADGSIALAADGLGTVLRLLLGDGTVDGTELLSAATWERMTTPNAPGGEDAVGFAGCLPVTQSRYGFGINTERVDGADCLTHGGGMIGYASFVLADRTHGLAVGVLTNADGDCLAAQQLARFAHQALVAERRGAALPPLPDVDTSVRAGTPCEPIGLVGLVGTDAAGQPVPVRIDAPAPGDVVTVHADGAVGRLYRDGYGRLATDHPRLRLHWLTAPDDSAPEDTAPDDSAPDERLLAALPGHYRAHTPWFTNFRIVARAGRLLLTACRGVEAPTEDLELVPLADGTLRVGAPAWLPERLAVRATVAGQAVLLDLDGCAYSRTGTP
jgi:CubicO group peptidase (beta-lactamase class C family)